MTEQRNNTGKVPNKGCSCPRIRFPEFKDAWEAKKLGNLLEFKNGINASKEQYGKGIKFINVLDILNNDFITYSNIVGSVDIDSLTVEKYSVKYGDLLFQRSSETREDVGTATVYLDKEKTATFGGFVIRGRKIGDYDPVFFNKLLKTNSARESITSKSGGSTRYNVGQDILSSITLNFPRLFEQKKIASFLSLIDERITTQNKIIEQLETLMQGLREKLFKQQIRFKNENGSDFPHWEMKKLGEILTIGSGKDYKYLKRGDVPVFGTGGLMTYVDSFLYNGETVCIGRKGTINKPMYYKGKIWTVDTLFYTYSFLNCVPKFIFYIFQSINWLEFNEASGVPSLSKNTIEKIQLSIPSFPEQTRIADFLTSIDEKIEVEKKILERYENQKKYLLQNLFI